MKKLFLLFKWMAVGSFSLLVSACYGVAYRLDDACWRMKSGTVKVKNGEGEPIPGLSVVVSDAANPEIPFASAQTDADGVAAFSVGADSFSTYQVDVIDHDGPENRGEFQQMTQPISAEELAGSDLLEIDVTLKER